MSTQTKTLDIADEKEAETDRVLAWRRLQTAASPEENVFTIL